MSILDHSFRLHDWFSQGIERFEIGKLRGLWIGGEVSVK